MIQSPGFRLSLGHPRVRGNYIWLYLALITDRCV